MIQAHPDRPMTALDAIFTRRSVREYTSYRLDESTVRALLDAAVQAPTAMHMEPWTFMVIQDPVILKRLSDRAKGHWASEASHYRTLHTAADPAMARAFTARFASEAFCIFYDAPTLIVVCAKNAGPFAAADCWLAAGNLMLAACALGLGTCCIGSAVPVLNSPETRRELGIPRDVEAIAPIVVGVARAPGVEVARRAPDILLWK